MAVVLGVGNYTFSNLSLYVKEVINQIKDIIMDNMAKIKMRLEYLRQELRNECMSYGEIAELQGLAKYIEVGDVELLEAAGIPEDYCII